MPKGVFVRTEKTRQKMSESKLGENNPMYGKVGNLHPRYGKNHSEKTKQKMSKAKTGKKHPMYGKIGSLNPMYGKKRTEETRQKIGEANKDKKRTEEAKQKNRLAHLGKKHTEEHKRKISEALKGENNPSWKGGLSFEPYSVEFNNQLKEQIRERDGRLCQFCGEEENGNKHDVHHINYDKKDCRSINLLTVCHFCNRKANCQREKWQMFFEILQEIRGI